jgi:outer membrane protein assembly factor BamB
MKAPRLAIVAAVALIASATPARAQLDPLWFLRGPKPYVIVAVDTVSGGPEAIAIRVAAARAALSQAIAMNVDDARFGLIEMTVGAPGEAPSARILVSADEGDATGHVQRLLAAEDGLARPELPVAEIPLEAMAIAAEAEVARLRSADSCSRTVLVIVAGNGSLGSDVSARAAAILSSPDTPVSIVGVEASPGVMEQLAAAASAVGGRAVQISTAMLDAARDLADVLPSPVASTIVVPEFVAALNESVQRGYVPSRAGDLETLAAAPVVGTVRLSGARDISGNPLPSTVVTDRMGATIPQPDNVLITTAVALPGFAGRLRAFRQYRPERDPARATGYAFVADGARLWVAAAPADSSRRNLFTASADGALIPFSASDPEALAAIATMMGTTTEVAARVVSAVRALPLGPVLDAQPVVVGAPAGGPVDDPAYREFARTHRDRRALVWAGTNAGVLEAIDARLGIEVWGFIPPNLLPRLRRLLLGQGLSEFTFLVDGPVKAADVRVAGRWRTDVIVGQGPGGTFYDSLDVTLDGLAERISPESDDVDRLLAAFADRGLIRLNWSFPRYADFDPSLGPDGDVRASAPALAKTVGQTWSTPAIARARPDGDDFLFVGSGPLPPAVQASANRAGTTAGSTLYVLDAVDGTVVASSDVGGTVVAGPVGAGSPGSRTASRLYVGDARGRVWRFDLGVDPRGRPELTRRAQLWNGAADQPILTAIAAQEVGGREYLFFGTGGDAVAAGDEAPEHHLMGLIDDVDGGRVVFARPLARGSGGSERVSASPAVAGDVVFFSTTVVEEDGSCVSRTANLYAFTYAGGAAYDSNGDGRADARESPLVSSVRGAAATAPVAVDRHLVVGFGDSIAIAGDPRDYNGALAHTGVRVLSWRQRR